jgi:hypothetical protein
MSAITFRRTRICKRLRTSVDMSQTAVTQKGCIYFTFLFTYVHKFKRLTYQVIVSDKQIKIKFWGADNV